MVLRSSTTSTVSSGSTTPAGSVDAAHHESGGASWDVVAHDDATVAERLTRLVAAGLLELPLPGGGQTRRRHDVLAGIAAADLSLARLAEGHVDALAILAEAGMPTDPAVDRLGVWAADPPDGRVSATAVDGGWRLDGTKRWCSGTGLLDAALVTAHAADGYRLFRVDLAAEGVRAAPAAWKAVGMADSATGDVGFRAVHVPAGAAIGGPGWYLDRPGFWAGGIGVAACWYGGALGLVRHLIGRLRGRDDPHRRAELGAAAALTDAARCQLDDAADRLDAGLAGDALRDRAWTVRSGVELSVHAALGHLERGLGAGALTHDPEVGRLVADLPVYLRQHHGGRDLAALGGVLSG